MLSYTDPWCAVSETESLEWSVLFRRGSNSLVHLSSSSFSPLLLLLSTLHCRFEFKAWCPCHPFSNTLLCVKLHSLSVLRLHAVVYSYILLEGFFFCHIIYLTCWKIHILYFHYQPRRRGNGSKSFG